MYIFLGQTQTAEDKRIDALASELLEIQIQVQLFSDYIGAQKLPDGFTQIEESAIRGEILKTGQVNFIFCSLFILIFVHKYVFKYIYIYLFIYLLGCGTIFNNRIKKRHLKILIQVSFLISLQYS